MGQAAHASGISAQWDTEMPDFGDDAPRQKKHASSDVDGFTQTQPDDIMMLHRFDDIQYLGASLATVTLPC